MLEIYHGKPPYVANGYLFYSGGEALVIDVPLGTAPQFEAFLLKNKLTLKAIVATHVHWDHTEDMNMLRMEMKAKVFMHNFDAVGQDTINSQFPRFEKILHDENIEEGTKIRIGKKDFTFLHTPGHTPGSVCVWDKEDNVIFSGDTLFAGIHGRTDLPLGSPKDMKESLSILANLSKETRVYPGHGEPTKIGDEDWLRNFQ